MLDLPKPPDDIKPQNGIIRWDVGGFHYCIYPHSIYDEIKFICLHRDNEHYIFSFYGTDKFYVSKDIVDVEDAENTSLGQFLVFGEAMTYYIML